MSLSTVNRGSSGGPMTAASVPLDTMTPEAKRGLLAALIRDLSKDGGPLSFQEGGQSFYVYTPLANARELAEQDIRNCTAEERAELQRRIDTLEDSVSYEEALRLTNRPRETPSP